MANTVTYKVYREVVGENTIELPDHVDTSNPKAIRDYIESVWETENIPDVEDCEPVDGTEEFDRESSIWVLGENGIEVIM